MPVSAFSQLRIATSDQTLSGLLRALARGASRSDERGAIADFGGGHAIRRVHLGHPPLEMPGPYVASRRRPALCQANSPCRARVSSVATAGAWSRKSASRKALAGEQARRHRYLDSPRLGRAVRRWGAGRRGRAARVERARRVAPAHGRRAVHAARVAAAARRRALGGGDRPWVVHRGTHRRRNREGDRDRDGGGAGRGHVARRGGVRGRDGGRMRNRGVLDAMKELFTRVRLRRARRRAVQRSPRARGRAARRGGVRAHGHRRRGGGRGSTWRCSLSSRSAGASSRTTCRARRRWADRARTRAGQSGRGRTALRSRAGHHAPGSVTR